MKQFTNQIRRKEEMETKQMHGYVQPPTKRKKLHKIVAIRPRKIPINEARRVYDRKRIRDPRFSEIIHRLPPVSTPPRKRFPPPPPPQDVKPSPGRRGSLHGSRKIPPPPKD